MSHQIFLSSLSVLIALVCGSLSLSALPQQQPSSTAAAPVQARRAEPPPVNATPAQLELRGDELSAQKFYADALDYYRAAVTKGEDNATLENKIGIAELQMMRYGDAKKSFERAIKLDRHYAEAYNNLGVIQYLHRKYGKAIKDYQKAIQMRETSASFHSNLGTAYFSRKEYEKASAEYSRALQLDPDIFEHRSSAGIAAQMASPEDRAHYSYVIAKMYARLGNPERSLQYLKKSMEEGYSDIGNVYKDEEFAALRQDKRFAELMASKPVTLPN